MKGEKKGHKERKREIPCSCTHLFGIWMGKAKSMKAKHEIVKSGRTLRSVLTGSRKKLKPTLDTII